MRFRLPAVAQIEALTALFATDRTLRLFTNDVEAGLTEAQINALTDADFTEATFTGYAPATLTGGAWAFTSGDPSLATYALTAFTSTANQPLQNIRGYYFTRPSGDFDGYYQFDAPIPVEFNGDAINVTPVRTMSDSEALMKPGMSINYYGATLPDGFLWEDGAAVSRTTYDRLFAELGETFGPGDGSTTFNLPDSRGRFMLGKALAGTGSGLGDTGGEIDHTHDLTPGYAVGQGGSGHFRYIRTTVNAEPYNRELTIAGATDNQSGGTSVAGIGLGGQTGGQNPPFLVCQRIIKY